MLGLLARGFSYAEIAGLLTLSAQTVGTHVKNLYRKLEVNNRAEAVKDLMLANDSFSKLLGLEVDEVGPGSCRLLVRPGYQGSTSTWTPCAPPPTAPTTTASSRP